MKKQNKLTAENWREEFDKQIGSIVILESLDEWWNGTSEDITFGNLYSIRVKSFISKLLEAMARDIMDNILGFNDRGIVTYMSNEHCEDVAICNNCGKKFKGKEAKKMMFGHIGCTKPNGYFVRNDIDYQELIKIAKKYGVKL